MHDRSDSQTSGPPAEARLRYLELLLGRSPAIVFLWRFEHDFPVEFVTDNVSLLGYTPDDFYSGRVNWVAITYSEDVERLREEVEGFLASDADAWAQEYRLIDGHGQVRWIEDRNQVIRDESGNITHIQGAILDVSDRKQIEAALEASRQSFTSIVERSREGIIVVGRGRAIHFMNDAARHMLAQHRGASAGNPLPFQVDPETATRLPIVREDGEVGIGEVQASLTEWDAQQATLVTIRDITPQLAAEEQVQQQRAMAIRGDRLRSLGEMAASIAHEINQPLTGIRGAAEHLLLSSERGWHVQPEATADRLSLIVGQVDRLDQVVKHVRQFAHAPSRVNRARLSLNTVAERALSLIRVQYSVHEIDLHLEADESLPDIVANDCALEEILHNLLSNARYAVEQRARRPAEPGYHPTVIVRTGHDAGHAWLQVVDNGIGIDDDHLPHVFESFYTTKPATEGTGLGLSLVRRMAAEFHGTVDLDSKPGHGTTATVRFPRA